MRWIAVVAAPLLLACSGSPGQNLPPLPSTGSIADWAVDTARTEVAVDLRALAIAPRVRPAGAIGLAGGRTAVLDGNAARVMYFARDGMLERTVALAPPDAGSPVRPVRLVRVAGDTISVLALGRAYVLDDRGNIVRTVNAEPLVPPAGGRPQIRAILAPLTRGRTVLGYIGPQQPPTPDVTRWVDSMRVVVVDSGMNVVQELGRWPTVYIGIRDGTRTQVWFAPTGVVASRDSILYFGFGSEYRIDAFAPSGRLLRSFARPWTRVPVTDADIDAFVEGWANNWITGTPEEVERQKRALRGDPYFPYVPAFSEALVATSGELWVRSPNLIDAQSAGELYHHPLVPSRWSIFDPHGRWIGRATLPALAHPSDVHNGVVLSIGYGPHAGKVLRHTLQPVAR